MKAIYPVTEMIKAYPFLFGLIPEKERNEILKSATGWSRNQIIKISMRKENLDTCEISNERMWENIIDSLHDKMKQYSISDVPLYGDPISQAVYGYINKINNMTEHYKNIRRKYYEEIKTETKNIK